MIVLGIETSCDETSAGIVEDGHKLLSLVTATSMDLHVAYGGVVPEIAARSHIESIIPVIDQALENAFGLGKGDRGPKKQHPQSSILNLQSSDPWDQIDAIAVTYGAGLGGCLLVGVTTAKTLAITKNKPLYAVNHVEGHVYANFLTEVSGSTKLEILNSEVATEPSTKTWSFGDQTYKLPTKPPEFPILALIVSGKHTQLVLFKDHFDYIVLGKTRDDAIGEAFDKVAKLLGLPYPGGPSVAKSSLNGDPNKYKLPKSKLESPYDFSFSGLKTAVLRLAQEQIGEDFTFPSFNVAERLSETQKSDIASSFQRTAVETVVDKTILAFKEFNPKSVVIAGGASANLELRRQLTERLSSLSTKFETRNVETNQKSEKRNQKKDSIPTTNYQPPDPTFDAENVLHFTDQKLCTDNGAMIAVLGFYKALLGQEPADPYTLDIQPSLRM